MLRTYPFLLTEQCTTQIWSLRQNKISFSEWLWCYTYTVYANAHCFGYFSMPHKISFRQLLKRKKTAVYVIHI